ncbi:hypothetical protein SPRG_14129 [Saprolegnia parasitica CBS 223.65]|uniref:Myb-like domain-containing protein n=1 Tax=Saprolegnia parasitica (strain CBS 223.65) TaxID=695850 RepID=A0A067BRL3_SAPPC|nr:hypothetical protein SPRG_14129 [Saprolegnia parasitica CBS 223.65]KDO20898.1 hypothetical protein SPRG_14129 [Saprolegnia parasitica CBS 223.65]|eukprot:XP_012208387.1 hypothetical protein SPRG_14129 [Saprolegnia parasitica CBS 223.65]
MQSQRNGPAAAVTDALIANRAYMTALEETLRVLEAREHAIQTRICAIRTKARNKVIHPAMADARIQAGLAAHTKAEATVQSLLACYEPAPRVAKRKLPFLAAEYLVQNAAGKVVPKRIPPVTSVSRHLAPYREELRDAIGAARILERRANHIKRILQRLPPEPSAMQPDDWVAFVAEHELSKRPFHYALAWNLQVSPHWRRAKWTLKEDEALATLVETGATWDVISTQIARVCKTAKRRPPVDCLMRVVALRAEATRLADAGPLADTVVDHNPHSDRRLLCAVYMLRAPRMEATNWATISHFVGLEARICRDRYWTTYHAKMARARRKPRPAMIEDEETEVVSA